MTPETLVYLSIAIKLVIAGLLVYLINSQRTIITGYKDLLATIDPKKIREANEHIEKGTEAKYKALMAAQIPMMIDDATKGMLATDEQFRKEYNELMTVAIIQLARMSAIDRTNALVPYPVCGDTIRRHVKQLLDQGGSEGAGG